MSIFLWMLFDCNCISDILFQTSYDCNLKCVLPFLTSFYDLGIISVLQNTRALERQNCNLSFDLLEKCK